RGVHLGMKRPAASVDALDLLLRLGESVALAGNDKPHLVELGPGQSTKELVSGIFLWKRKCPELWFRAGAGVNGKNESDGGWLGDDVHARLAADIAGVDQAGEHGRSCQAELKQLQGIVLIAVEHKRREIAEKDQAHDPGEIAGDGRSLQIPDRHMIYSD